MILLICFIKGFPIPNEASDISIFVNPLGTLNFQISKILGSITNNLIESESPNIAPPL